jgi:hypothetical protein
MRCAAVFVAGAESLDHWVAASSPKYLLKSGKSGLQYNYRGACELGPIIQD